MRPAYPEQMVAIFDAGPPSPCPASFNMASYVLGRAADFPDKVALAIISPAGAERWSYQRLEAAVRGTATGLLDNGAKAGDRVVLRLGNTVDFPIAYLAALAVDLIPVPLSAALVADEVDKVISDLSPRLIVAADGLPLPETVSCPVISGPALAALRACKPADYVHGDPNRPGYIIYTSGTSGVPRAVTHAHRAIWARRMMWDGWYGLQDTDRLLHAGAFNWTYTLGTGLMDPWSIGATALIPAEGVDAGQLPLLLKRYDATIFAAAPGVYRKALKSAFPSLPKLRHGLSAGEKLPQTTREAWQAATGRPVFEAFGMSECSTFISSSPSHPAPDGAIGFPQEGRRVAVLSENGPADFDTPGVLAISDRDNGLMLSYWGAQDDTATRFRGEWFLTGDTVSMAPSGALTYLGRQDDMMNAGGIRVSPIEVETVMTTHPLIQECAAAEVKIKADVTVIAAFFTSDGEISDVELNKHAAARLAEYKRPRLFVRVDELPKGANNKILRRALRTNWETAHGQA